MLGCPGRTKQIPYIYRQGFRTLGTKSLFHLHIVTVTESQSHTEGTPEIPGSVVVSYRSKLD